MGERVKHELIKHPYGGVFVKSTFKDFKPIICLVETAKDLKSQEERAESTFKREAQSYVF